MPRTRRSTERAQASTCWWVHHRPCLRQLHGKGKASKQWETSLKEQGNGGLACTMKPAGQPPYTLQPSRLLFINRCTGWFWGLETAGRQEETWCSRVGEHAGVQKQLLSLFLKICGSRGDWVVCCASGQHRNRTTTSSCCPLYCQAGRGNRSAPTELCRGPTSVCVLHPFN